MALSKTEEKNLDIAISECRNPNYNHGRYYNEDENGNVSAAFNYDGYDGVNAISIYADKHFGINLAERGDALRYVQDIVL